MRRDWFSAQRRVSWIIGAVVGVSALVVLWFSISVDLQFTAAPDSGVAEDRLSLTEQAALKSSQLSIEVQKHPGIESNRRTLKSFYARRAFIGAHLLYPIL